MGQNLIVIWRMEILSTVQKRPNKNRMRTESKKFKSVKRKKKKRISKKKRLKFFRLCLLAFIIVAEISILLKVVIKDVDTSKNQNTNYNSVENESSEKSVPNKFTVFIDPGHGFSDPGTLSPEHIGSVNESEIVLTIGKKLSKILLDKGLNVILSRQENYDKRQDTLDEFYKLSTEQRVDMAIEENADIFISLHIDSIDTKIKDFESINGYTIYYCDNDIKKNNHTIDLAKCIKEEFYNSTKVSKLNLSSMESDDAFYVVNHTTMPSILFELGYSTNRQDAARLIDSRWQHKAAQGIANGVIKYYNQYFNND